MFDVWVGARRDPGPFFFGKDQPKDQLQKRDLLMRADLGGLIVELVGLV